MNLEPHVFHATVQKVVAGSKSPPRRKPREIVTQDDSRYMPKG